jgi:hypothetical protein
MVCSRRSQRLLSWRAISLRGRATAGKSEPELSRGLREIAAYCDPNIRREANGGLTRHEVNNVEPNQDGPITGLCGVSR